MKLHHFVLCVLLTSCGLFNDNVDISKGKTPAESIDKTAPAITLASPSIISLTFCVPMIVGAGTENESQTNELCIDKPIPKVGEGCSIEEEHAAGNQALLPLAQEQVRSSQLLDVYLQRDGFTKVGRNWQRQVGSISVLAKPYELVSVSCQ